MAEDYNHNKEKDKDPTSNKKAKRNRKVYPPHWEIRCFGYNEKTRKPHYIVSSKSIPWYIWFEVKHAKIGDCWVPREFDSLETELNSVINYRPETRDWPVRFINGEHVECGREIIK